MAPRTSAARYRSACRYAGPAVHGHGHRGAAGFTLVELMITLAIVAILAAIAYPGYRTYVLKAHRTDAERVLTNNAQILQRCYTQNFTYTGCTNLATASPNGYYTVANTVTATTYSLVATATGNQTADTNCASFTVTQTGTQTSLSSGAVVTTTTCWGGT